MTTDKPNQIKNFEPFFAILSHKQLKTIFRRVKMKNQTRSNSQTVLIAAIAAVFMFAASSLASAQEVNTTYKVGDRVGCDFTFKGEYKEGTVAEVFVHPDNAALSRYRVKIDSEANDPLWKDGRNCWDKNMRSIGGEANKNQAGTEPTKNTPPQNDKKPNADNPEDFTYLADREPLDCPIEQKQVKANARPDAELLKKVIRCLYERRAPAGVTGAKTVDITAFQIGTARKWRPLDDIGSGNLNTIVYPIKANWTEKTFYESFTQQIDSISIFNCYVNAVGEWECGLGQRIKESDPKRIPRQE